jgi:hypothetical protein
MDGAMDIGVVLAVVLNQCINDGQRLLASSRIIEIDQRLIVNRPLQDGEI